MDLSYDQCCRKDGYAKIRAIVGVGLIAILCVVFMVSLSVLGETVSKVATLTISAALKTGVDPVSVSFTIDPDASPSDTATLQIEVCVNNPPTAFSIGLFSSIAGLDFSYHLLGVGGDTVPVLPIVSWQNLLSLGCTSYVLELTATVGPGFSSGSYQRDVQVQFQAAGIINNHSLHLDITVLPRSPVVDAGPDQTVSEGDTVAFSGSYNDPDVGETYTIGWDFGDGTTTTGTLTPTHTYSDNGIYTVTLTVTDSGGRFGQDTLTVTVDDLGPTAYVVSVPPSIPLLTVAVGEEVTFDATGSTSSPDAIVSYEWDWDYIGLVFDPSGDTGKTAIHAYAEAGAYTVAVLVTDDDGSTDIAVLDVEVIVTPATTTEVSSATPEVAGAGGALATTEVEIDELYVHHQALAVSQFHLVSPGAPVEPSTPVIYFPFDEGSGEYAYNQIDMLSGNESVLKGTLSQPNWVEGAPVHANAFAVSLGENGYVEIPADQRMSFSWNQDFTLEFWVRATDSDTERPLLQREYLESNILYGVNLFEGQPLFYVSAAVDNYTVVKGSKSIDDGTWHHIACIRENGTLKLYVDGALADALTPETLIAGAGGGNLSSEAPSYVGGPGETGESLGGLVDASYRIGETIEFQMRITDETETLILGAAPSLLFIRYDYLGQKMSSGLVGRLSYDPNEEAFAYSLGTSTYEEGIYDFFLVLDDGSQQRLRIMLLEIE